MATEVDKKLRQLKLFNNIIGGQSKALYNLFGDSALGMMGPIGEEILQEMEREMGLEVQAEDPVNILTELGRILVDEYGLLSDFELKSLGGGKAQITCRNCLLKPASMHLKASDIPAYTCVPNALITAVLRNRLGLKSHLTEIQVEEDYCLLTGFVGDPNYFGPARRAPPPRPAGPPAQPTDSGLCVTPSFYAEPTASI
jgi:hypothetical protein